MMNKMYLFQEFKMRMINYKEDHALRLIVDAYAEVLACRVEQDEIHDIDELMNHDCGDLDRWVDTLLKVRRTHFTEYGKPQFKMLGAYRALSRRLYNIVHNSDGHGDKLYTNFMDQYVAINRIRCIAASIDKAFADDRALLPSKQSENAHVMACQHQIFHMFKTAFRGMCFEKDKNGKPSDYVREFTPQRFVDYLLVHENESWFEDMLHYMIKFSKVKALDSDRTIIEEMIDAFGTVSDDLRVKLDDLHSDFLMDNTQD